MDDVAIWHRLLSPGEVRTLFHQATDPELRRNVAQVERTRHQDRRTTVRSSKEFSYDQATEQGLAPSILRRFVEVLAAADGDPRSSLVALTTTPITSVDDAMKLLAAKNDPLRKLLDDEKSGPFAPGADFSQFYDVR